MPCTCQPDQATILAAITATHNYLYRLEQVMTTQAEGISNLGARFDALAGVVTDISNDFTALLAALEAERENLSPAGQAALDEATTKADEATARLGELDVAVGDADGSDTPPPAEPTEEPTV